LGISLCDSSRNPTLLQNSARTPSRKLRLTTIAFIHVRSTFAVWEETAISPMPSRRLF
jgi:hypothetical protein